MSEASKPTSKPAAPPENPSHISGGRPTRLYPLVATIHDVRQVALVFSIAGLVAGLLLGWWLL